MAQKLNGFIKKGTIEPLKPRLNDFNGFGCGSKNWDSTWLEPLPKSDDFFYYLALDMGESETQSVASLWVIPSSPMDQWTRPVRLIRPKIHLKGHKRKRPGRGSFDLQLKLRKQNKAIMMDRWAPPLKWSKKKDIKLKSSNIDRDNLWFTFTKKKNKHSWFT